VQDAPYLLEEICDQYGQGPATSGEVKHAMLTASVELFCARPAECMPLMKHVLSRALKDPDHIVKEKASLYAKLLEGLGADGTRRLVRLPALPSGETNATDASQELQDILFDEWNTLSVVYGEPSSTFIAAGSTIKRSFSADSLGGGGAVEVVGTDSLIEVDGEGEGDVDDAIGGDLVGDLVGELGGMLGSADLSQDESSLLDDGFSFLGVSQAPTPTSANELTAATSGSAQSPAMDDLDLLMMMGADAAPAAPPAAAPPTYELRARRDVGICQDEFKKQWSELEMFAVTSTSQLGSSAVDDLDRHVEQANLVCLGKSPSRFLFYGCSMAGCGVCVCITISGMQAALDVRSKDAGLAASVKDTVDTLLCVF